MQYPPQWLELLQLISEGRIIRARTSNPSALRKRFYRFKKAIRSDAEALPTSETLALLAMRVTNIVAEVEDGYVLFRPRADIDLELTNEHPATEDPARRTEL